MRDIVGRESELVHEWLAEVGVPHPNEQSAVQSLWD